MDNKTYGPKEICKLASITTRQLGYWKLIGVVKPHEERRGSKTFHRYSEYDLEVLRAVKRLTEQGYLVSKAAAKIKEVLESGGEISPGELLALPRMSASSDGNAPEAIGSDEFGRRVDEELARSRRFGYSLSCLAIRVEIKPQADGEIVEEIMKQAHMKLAAYKRAYDLVARVDSSELLWLLCQTSPAGARVVADTVRKVLEDGTWVVNGISFRIDSRVGAATIDFSGTGTGSNDDAARLIEQARAQVRVGT